MSKKKHRRRCKNSHGIWGMWDRVVDGLSQALGLGHGLVITGIVFGFIFVPLLTTIVLLVTLYWVSYPEQARSQLDQVSSYVRRAGHRLSDAAFTRERRRTATDPRFDDVAVDEPPAPKRPSTTSSELRERFEALDKRAKSIEAFVASEEYRLEREFKRMGDEKD